MSGARSMATTPNQGPDFSGKWTLSLQASRLSPIVGPTVRSGVLQIEHFEPRFKGHLTIVFEGGPVESRFELLSDGREVVAKDAFVMSCRTTVEAFERPSNSAAGAGTRTISGSSRGRESEPALKAPAFCRWRSEVKSRLSTAAA